MRILIFHGYLLGGTGSNVYNARLAAALVELGHEVHLLCQDRQPEQQAFVDATGDWEGGTLCVRALREPVRCTAYRPDIGGLLPVYVMDRYEGIQARPFAECSEEEVDRYLAANVAAVREVTELVKPDMALANHLVMGPVILARALAGEVPYAVKVHGSALEYTVKPNRERFLGLAREGLDGANAVLVGSHHTAASLWEALGDPVLVERTRLGPPGVDIARFAPRAQAEAAEAVRGLGTRLRVDASGSSVAVDLTAAEMSHGGTEANAFARDDLAAATALERLNPGQDRLVAFVGKLIVNKGVDLLIAAWPLVLRQVPEAKLVVVGFGADREQLERLLGALAANDLEGATEGARRHLRAFLGALRGIERERYLSDAQALSERVVFTGRLDHEELIELLPACEALVVPSTFPEAFGMVAAEGAACGAFPVSAAHSGLAEVSSVLARYIPAEVAQWLSFAVDDGAVSALGACLTDWLGADPELRARTREGLVEAVCEHWSWERVARGVIAAASGELDDLAVP
ncbi:MAG TPA: glycosyltransferase family 4 protein [Solirubrobacteraceae bacterium]|jgi:glycosyltransferase involved in cell wall biosynthesis